MRRTLSIGLVAAMLLVGCGDQVQTGTIAWYRTPCSGNGLTAYQCTVVIDEAGVATSFHGWIDGYTPVWGVEADVRYVIEGPSGDPDDVGKYEIQRVVATRTVAAGTTAAWQVPASRRWFTADGDRVRLLGTPVACAPALCADLIARNEAAVPFVVDIEATGDPAVPVRALAIRAP